MLSDGLILALIVLLPIGFGVGAVYVLRRLRGRHPTQGVQRSHRVIGDRERKWELIVIALVSVTKIPPVLSLLPELTKAGLGGTLLNDATAVQYECMDRGRGMEEEVGTPRCGSNCHLDDAQRVRQGRR
jgi:hypothetical protein